MRDKSSKSDSYFTPSQGLGYNFEPLATYEVYRELMTIAQEIETCRASL